MHSITVDRINRLVEQRVSGALDLAGVVETGAAVRKAVRSLGTAPGAHLTLYDLSELSPVGDDVVGSAIEQFADPRFSCVKARKVAMVVPSALMRLKLAGPLGTRDNLAVFADRPAAMRWLFAS